MLKAIKSTLPIAESIVRLLHPHAEVVVHDIKKNQIAAIFNPFSKRGVGEASLLSQEEMAMLADCVGPYEKTNWDGRKLKSISSVIRDDTGEAVGMVCINLDISTLKQMNEVIAGLIGVHQLVPQPAALFKDDWQEKLNNYIHTYLREHHLSLDAIKRDDKKQLIEHLQKIGAFTGKHAALYIAQVIGVSRATIYNYLS